MVEIKNIVFTKIKFNPIKCFFCFINHLLPIRLKFANESFVALVDNKIQALITLEKDSKSNSRFKITKLILENPSIAKELVNYVITRYRAQGASSFYVVVDELHSELLNIFKNELNFRMCSLEHLYKINPINSSYSLILRPFKKESVNGIKEFYNQNINSYNRFTFSRENYQFFNGYSKYVFYNDEENQILGYFEVSTKDNHNYYINFSIDSVYNIYLVDAIKYIYSKVKQKNKNALLFIKVKDYFMNSKEIMAILKENNAEFVSKSEILAKDYFQQIKEGDLFKSSKIIFNDPTTA